jgi:porphobilinogen synthase
MTSLPLTRRNRRNRRTPAIRALVEETRLAATDLIQPLFVIDGDGPPEPISSMPGVLRYPIADLLRQCERVQASGIPAVALFPRIDDVLKDGEGSHALDQENLLYRAVRAVKQAFPDLLVITDVALDPYTSHGHDGVLSADGQEIDNDRSVVLLAQLAVLESEAGADWVAPSDMMDGRVGAIRRSLDEAGHTGTGILAYSAKFASAYYGPFREAVGSLQAAGTAHLDKRTYQMNPANRREAILDALLDEEEGADVLMVKPAGPYLDVLRDLREATRLPLAAYQVSGEYAQIHAAAQAGWLDLERIRDESLLAIKRAGADMILTYFALDYMQARQG